MPILVIGVIERDKNSRRVRIQTKLMMVHPHILWQYFCETFEGAIVDNKIRLSESTFRKWIPNWVKLASGRHKIMCGCTTCVIFDKICTKACNVEERSLSSVRSVRLTGRHETEEQK